MFACSNVLNCGALSVSTCHKFLIACHGCDVVQRGILNEGGCEAVATKQTCYRPCHLSVAVC